MNNQEIDPQLVDFAIKRHWERIQRDGRLTDIEIEKIKATIQHGNYPLKNEIEDIIRSVREWESTKHGPQP